MSNRASGQSLEELTARAVAALVREWGVTDAEARAAIERAQKQEQRLGPELSREWTWHAA
jgi:hypothetical protein